MTLIPVLCHIGNLTIFTVQVSTNREIHLFLTILLNAIQSFYNTSDWNGINLVFSRRNATNQMPFCEMPLTVVFEVWGFGVGESIFVVRIWEMAFWHFQNLNKRSQSVCLYLLFQWLALRFPNAAIYLDTMRECYEAYVIYNFMTYLLAYLWENYPFLDRDLSTQPDIKLTFPLCWLKPWNGK